MPRRFRDAWRLSVPDGVILRGLAGACAILLTTIACAQEPGQTPRPKDAPPPPNVPEEELVRLDKSFPHFQFVEDPGPFIYRGDKIMDARRESAAIRELKAYEYVLAFANRQPIERLRKYSTKDVPVENLFRPIRQDYLRELLHIEGKLALILAMKPTEDLKALEGIEQLYEVWVWPRGSTKLVCVVVSELPEGLQPGEDFNKWVSFDAYYFKLFHYESRQGKEKSDDPDKKQWHRAPLFLGKSVELKGTIQEESTYTPGMLVGVLGGLLALGLAGFLMTLWFRRSDRHIRTAARQKIEAQAMFDDSPGQPGPVN
jgi:hypothetical protein